MSENVIRLLKPINLPRTAYGYDRKALIAAHVEIKWILDNDGNEFIRVSLFEGEDLIVTNDYYSGHNVRVDLSFQMRKLG